MKYPCLDGYVIISNPLQPVSHTLNVPGYSNGTWINYETSSKSDNTLQQIKITRVVDDEVMTVTVEEQNQEEINEYISGIRSEEMVTQSEQVDPTFQYINISSTIEQGMTDSQNKNI